MKSRKEEITQGRNQTGENIIQKRNYIGKKS